MRRAALGFLLTAIFLTAEAHADWDTRVEDDIFSGGKKAMLLGMISLHSFIVADCVTGGDLSFSYAEKGDFTDIMSSGNFRFLLKVDTNPPIESKAVASARNTEIFQIGTEDRDTIIQMLKEIEVAKRSVLVGIEEPTFDMKFSATARASGSTKAVKRFMQACALEGNPQATD